MSCRRTKTPRVFAPAERVYDPVAGWAAASRTARCQRFLAMHRILPHIVVVLVMDLTVALTPCAALTAQTQVTISPSKDNTLYESSTGALSNGAGSRCFAGRIATFGWRRRALVAFDVAKQIPAGSKITKADLALTVVMSPSSPAPSPVTITLHRLTANWGEGSSTASGAQGTGASSQTNDATWIHRFYSSQKWSNAGGDGNATPSGSTAVGTSGTVTWASTPQMVADVQSWLDKTATNFGWLLLGDESTTKTARAFATKEDTTASNRPRLIVTYTPPKAQVGSVGSGCRGSATSPLVLAASGVPTVPNAAFGLGLSGGPSGNGLFGLGFSLLPNPLPLGAGCNLYVSTLPIFLVFNGNANRAIPLPIPNQQSLIGLTLHWQGGLADPKTGFLVTSNALTTRLGV